MFGQPIFFQISLRINTTEAEEILGDKNLLLTIINDRDSLGKLASKKKNPTTDIKKINAEINTKLQAIMTAGRLDDYPGPPTTPPTGGTGGGGRENLGLVLLSGPSLVPVGTWGIESRCNPHTFISQTPSGKRKAYKGHKGRTSRSRKYFRKS